MNQYDFTQRALPSSRAARKTSAMRLRNAVFDLSGGLATY